MLIKIGVFEVGAGGVLFGLGGAVLPISQVAGGILIGTGIVVETKGILDFKDWAERYGEVLRKIRQHQEQGVF